MKYLSGVSWITLVMIGLFVLPILAGMASPFSGSRMRRSIGSLFGSLIFLASIILAVYLEGLLLANPDSKYLTPLYKAVPSLYGFINSRDIWAEAVIVIVLTVIADAVIRLLFMPIDRFIIMPLAERMSSAADRMGGGTRRIVGGLWELPKGAALVLVFSLMLSVFVSYSGSASLEKSLSASLPYQYIDETILNPLMNSSLAKKIPVLLGDSFKEAASSLKSRNIHLIRYFNGMTLSDAVKSDADIDAAAKKIVGNETGEREKAKLLYVWITKNISYDDAKAVAVMKDTTGISSGAIVAYHTKTGICFDYACLYVAMCRAVDVRVRFVTGMGYSGAAWGDHAWNQVYDPDSGEWLNVDTTFGTSGRNYFDRTDFESDHQDPVIQGEW